MNDLLSFLCVFAFVLAGLAWVRWFRRFSESHDSTVHGAGYIDGYTDGHRNGRADGYHDASADFYRHGATLAPGWAGGRERIPRPGAVHRDYDGTGPDRAATGGDPDIKHETALT